MSQTSGRRSLPRSRWPAPAVAVAVAATPSPVAWVLSRPAPDAGVPLSQALDGSSVLPGGGTTAEPVAPGSADTPGAPATSGTPGTPGAAGGEASPDAVSAYGPVTVRDASAEAAAAHPLPAPARVRVESLGVDADVEAVGVEEAGSMVVPAEIDRVGWYRYGSVAGAEAGNTVLAGHVDAEGEGRGALFELREVEVGTQVTVTDEAGGEHVHEVVGRATVVTDVLPVAEIVARDGGRRLVVITCGGPFQPELSSNRGNVVVTAVPVNQA